MTHKPLTDTVLFVTLAFGSALALAHQHEAEEEHHSHHHQARQQSADTAPKSAAIAAPSTTKAEALWRAECGQSCHIAFPPAMLPERSWRKLMGALDKHFGEDAGLDAGSARAIEDYLVANSAEQSRSGMRRVLRNLSESQTPLRISEMPWFVREHRHVKAADWNLPKVKSAANCSACHPKAPNDFDEHSVRIPRG